MEKAQDTYIIFEDQDDYIEDVKEELRAGIKRYFIYCKMFGEVKDYRAMKEELKRFVHLEAEKMLHF
jgi:hypothetical protein